MIACLIGAFIGIDQIYPVRRPFNLTDPSIMYPFIEKGTFLLKSLVDTRTHSRLRSLFIIHSIPGGHNILLDPFAT